jgi:hypothetical protein
MEASIRSFDKLSDQRILRVQPDRLKIYTAQQGDTLTTLARRANNPRVTADELAILNRLAMINRSRRAGGQDSWKRVLATLSSSVPRSCRTAIPVEWRRRRVLRRIDLPEARRPEIILRGLMADLLEGNVDAAVQQSAPATGTRIAEFLLRDDNPRRSAM